jgi:hypothetical protein
MAKNPPPDGQRTTGHNVYITSDMAEDLAILQIKLRRANPNKSKRTISRLIGDRTWEALEARKLLASDEQSNHEKMKELYRIFQIQDPDQPKKK